MIVDITSGQGWTEREIGYTPDIRIDHDASKHPDIVADFRKLPLPDDFADMVVFDPPHYVGGSFDLWRSGPYVRGMSRFAKDYGAYRSTDDLVESIRGGMLEVARVLKPDGVCMFKWGGGIPVERILSLCTPDGLAWRILFQRVSVSKSATTTSWVELWRTA